MSKARLMALTGPLTILVGAMWMAASIGEFAILARPANADTFWDVFWLFPFLLSFIPMLFALIGTRLRFYQVAGGPGRLGLTLSVAGCVGMIISVSALILLGAVAPQIEQGPWANYLMAICLLGLMIGYVLFGIDALGYRLLPRWNVLPLLVGSAVVLRLLPELFGLRSYDPMQLTAYGLHFLITGACWVLLGIALMDDGREMRVVEAI